MSDHIYIGDLSADAQEAITVSVEKFRKGALEHGPLDVTQGRWDDAFLEELIDSQYYLIFELLKRKKERDGPKGERA